MRHVTVSHRSVLRLGLILGVVGMTQLGRAAEPDPVPVIQEDVDITHLTLNPPSREPRLRIGLESRFTTGKDSWKISFLETHPAFGDIQGRSKLEWDDLDSTVYVLHAEWGVNAWLRFAGSYGFGDIDDGKNTDTDWLGLDGGPEFLLFQSVADTSGDLTQFHLDALFRLNKIMSMNDEIGVWDVVVGYQYVEDDLRDRNGVATVDFTEPVNEPFDGLDSSYRFEWSALRFGLRGEYAITERWRARLSTIVLFGVDYKGEGHWNLRDDFRSEGPNFRHKSNDGYGSEVRMSLQFNVTPHVYIEGGYGWFRLRSKSGSDTTFFSDGTEGTSQLDWARSVRHGFFAGMGAMF